MQRGERGRLWGKVQLWLRDRDIVEVGVASSRDVVGRKNGLKPCLTPNSSRRILVLPFYSGIFFLLRFTILNLATSSKLGRELF